MGEKGGGVGEKMLEVLGILKFWNWEILEFFGDSCIKNFPNLFESVGFRCFVRCSENGCQFPGFI